MEERLSVLLGVGINDLKKTMENWMDNFKKETASDLPFIVDEYKKMPEYGDMDETLLRQILYSKKIDDNPLFKAVEKNHSFLSSPGETVDSKMSAFSIGLMTAHQTGEMVQHFGDEDINKKLLDELTSGKKYIPKWEKSLRIASNDKK